MAKKRDNEKNEELEKFFDAAARGDTQEVIDRNQAGLPVDSRDKNEKTVLMVTAEAGHLELTETLLDLGADVNARDHNGETSAMYAAVAGRLDMLKLLESKGANLSMQNDKKQNATQLAEEMGETAVVAWLVAQSASSTVPGREESPAESGDGDPIPTGSSEAENPTEKDGIVTASESESPDEWDESYESEGTNGFAETPSTFASFVPSAATAQAQKPVMTPLVSADEDAKNLAGLSSEYFGKARPASLSHPIPLDEIRQMIDATDRESDAREKTTGRVLSAQAKFRPDLLKDLRGIKDWQPDMGTIGRWKLAGDMEIEAEEAGEDTRPMSTYQLHACHKAPTREQRIMVVKMALEEHLSVREINKRVAPMVRKAKMAESGQLAEMSSQAAEIIEALEDPEAILRHPEKSVFLQDGQRLASEFTFAELSRIHEKAVAVETKRAKQKRALEEKAESFSPVISFLRLIKRTISGACEGNSD